MEPEKFHNMDNNEKTENKSVEPSLNIIPDNITKDHSKTRRILEIGSVGLWELNLVNELFTATNNSFKILGVDCPSLVMEFSEVKRMIIKKEDKENLEKKIVKIRRDNIFLDINFRIHSPDNEKRTLQLIAGKLDEFSIGGTISDITEVKKTERELIKSKNRAEKADFFKSAFLVNLSHELRTPMNAILGFTELLNQEPISQELRSEYTKIVKTRANYLLAFIDDINELAKFETGNVEIRKTSFLLYPVFTELYKEFEKKKIESGKNLTFVMNVPDELKNSEIFTDQGRLYQLMSILLSNAIKYTEKGSIEFGFRITSECFKFFVDDTGIGMTEEEQRNIFYRFNQIEETISGRYGRTGFSLAISRGIVELLGGKIKVKSELNKGSRFQFIIPFEVPISSEETIITDINDIKNINWKDMVILVAEDEDVNYKFIETILHKTQAQVLRAKTGIEAIDLCKKIGQINIVLMDIKMPVMNGFEACAEIKKIRPDLPVIAQTAYTSQDEILKGEEAGCVDYITKPIDIRQLIHKINLYV